MEAFSNKHWYYGRPPAIPYMLGILFYFFGVNDFVVDAPFIIISVLSVVMIYVLASVMYNPRIGLLSAFFFGLSPIYIFFQHRYDKAAGYTGYLLHHADCPYNTPCIKTEFSDKSLHKFPDKFLHIMHHVRCTHKPVLSCKISCRSSIRCHTGLYSPV